MDKRYQLMIESLFRSQGKESKDRDLIYWIGGYAHGRTAENNDPFLWLFSPTPGMEEKVCRVYEKDFPNLPDFVNTDVPEMVGTKNNPSKQTLIDSGRYIECPRFEVILFLGRDTQMGPEKRFLGVSRISRKSVAEWQEKEKQPAPAQPTRKPIATAAPKTKGVHESVVAGLGDEETIKTMLLWAWDQNRFNSKKDVLNAFNEQGLALTVSGEGKPERIRENWISYVKGLPQLELGYYRELAEAYYDSNFFYDSAYAFSKFFPTLDPQTLLTDVTAHANDNQPFDILYDHLMFQNLKGANT